MFDQVKMALKARAVQNELKKTEIDAKIEITDPSQLQAFLAEEEGMLKKMVDTVKKSGATVLFCQKGIDDLAQHYLAKDNIYAVRRVKKSELLEALIAFSHKDMFRIGEPGSPGLVPLGRRGKKAVAEGAP